MRSFYLLEFFFFTFLILSANCGDVRESEENDSYEDPEPPSSLVAPEDLERKPQLQERIARPKYETLSAKSSTFEPIFFPNHGESSGEEANVEDNEIPLALLKELATEDNLEKVFDKYVSNARIENVGGTKVLIHGGGSLVQDRFVGQTSGVLESVTQSAGCAPETRTVEVPLPPGNPLSVAIPKCVRIKQCGGCCGSSALVCEPVAELSTEVSVMFLEYNRSSAQSSRLAYKSTEKIMMQSHMECACNCKIKEQDCNASVHHYDPDACRCHCRNGDEQRLCDGQRHKIWDHKTCTCACRHIRECNSGLEVDPNTCKCAPIPTLSKVIRKRRRPTRKNPPTDATLSWPIN